MIPGKKKTVVSPLIEASRLAETWSPKVIDELDDYYVKVARLHGRFSWHSHDDEDELFLVLSGRLQIEYESGAVTLETGDLHVVPKGVPEDIQAKLEAAVKASMDDPDFERILENIQFPKRFVPRKDMPALVDDVTKSYEKVLAAMKNARPSGILP